MSAMGPQTDVGALRRKPLWPGEPTLLGTLGMSVRRQQRKNTIQIAMRCSVGFTGGLRSY
jgi:hypothetical protein